MNRRLYTTPVIKTAGNFARWELGAKPGDEIIYYDGILARDRDEEETTLTPKKRAALEKLADAAWRAYERGGVILLQVQRKRYNESGSRYIARKVV